MFRYLHLQSEINMPIIKSFVTCLLTGNNFSPKKLSQLTGLRFRSPSERGTLNQGGEKWMYGGASISTPYHINREGKYIDIDTMLYTLLSYKDQMSLCGVQDISLTLNFFCVSDMASWHLEYEQLKKLVELGIGLSIDWYQFENEEEIEK